MLFSLFSVPGFLLRFAKMQLKPMEINPEVSVRCTVAWGTQD